MSLKDQYSHCFARKRLAQVNYGHWVIEVKFQDGVDIPPSGAILQYANDWREPELGGYVYFLTSDKAIVKIYTD